MLPRDHYLKQAFQDPTHFPYGFEKGGLSDIQARLVRKNGTLISALTIDEVSDPTSDDLHILKVIANQSAPKSPVEQAWIKYLSIVKAFNVNNGNKGKSKAKTKAAAPAEEVAVATVEKTAKTSKAVKVAAEPAPAKKAATKTIKEPTPEKPTKTKKATSKA